MLCTQEMLLSASLLLQPNDNRSCILHRGETARPGERTCRQLAICAGKSRNCACNTRDNSALWYNCLFYEVVIEYCGLEEGLFCRTNNRDDGEEEWERKDLLLFREESITPFPSACCYEAMVDRTKARPMSKGRPGNGKRPRRGR